MMPEPRETPQPWWRGTRGEWYVVAQVALIALVFLGPRTMPGLPVWPVRFARAASILGVTLGCGGVALLLAGVLKLGAGLTPLPYPRPGTSLARTGAYGLVRHPMYSGGVQIAYGWGLLTHGWLTLLYATVLLIFLDIKSAREERWLAQKFDDYADYRRRVRKLIPFIY